MIKYRTTGIACLGLLAVAGFTRAAHADVQTSFRRAYTGSAGSNAYFGAGYTLEYGVGLNRAGQVGSVSADASADTWAKLFGLQINAVRIKGSGYGVLAGGTSACGASAGYETYLLGIKIPTASGTVAGGKYANKTLISRSQRLTPKAEINLVKIGPAVLGLEAYVSANEYVRLNGTVWCNGISGELRPGANLTAVANFRVDAVIVASGIRGTLTLEDASVPARLGASLSWSTQPNFLTGGSFCQWTVGVSASAALEFIPLSGSFEPYVRVGLPCTDIFGLLPGKGICLSKEWSQVLWSASFPKTTFPLAGQSYVPLTDYGTSCPLALPAAPAR